MKKKYISPKIKVREVNFESALLDASNTLNKTNPAKGLIVGTQDMQYEGEASNGSAGDAGAKSNVWTNWDEEE